MNVNVADTHVGKAKIAIIGFVVMFSLFTVAGALLRSPKPKLSSASSSPSPSASAIVTSDSVLDCIREVKGDPELEKACLGSNPLKSVASAAASARRGK